MSSPALDARIDALYQGPLDEFTGARNALAKTLTGDEKRRVASLQKPLTVPWIVNQTYWHSRSEYDELLVAGTKLRAAQVGALKGRSTDLRGAVGRHAEALTKVTAAAARLAQTAGVDPPIDALRRMFEVVSTSENLPAPHGRFVKPLEPAGFEALAGLAIAPPPPRGQIRTTREDRDDHAAGASAPRQRAKPSPADERRRRQDERRREQEARREERERAEAARRRQAAIQAAEKRAAQAVDAERRAKAAWEEARRQVEAADRALAELLTDEA